MARKVAAVRLGPATGGDISADGSAILVRNYWSAMYWPRAAGQTVVEALAKTPCRLTVSDVGYQGEAIGFTPDGAAYVTIAEGKPCLFRYACCEVGSDEHAHEHGPRYKHGTADDSDPGDDYARCWPSAFFRPCALGRPRRHRIGATSGMEQRVKDHACSLAGFLYAFVKKIWARTRAANRTLGKHGHTRTTTSPDDYPRGLALAFFFGHARLA